MKLIARSLIYTLLTFPMSGAYGNHNTIFLKEYKHSLSLVNQALLESKNNKSCPGIDIAKTCGNKICERHESSSTCKADCLDGIIRSYNHQTVCTGVKQVYYPKNVLEVQDAVQVALQTGLKVKVAGNGHSANDVICSDGLVISSKNLNKIIKVEKFNREEVVVVQPGATLGALAEWLHKKDLSLGLTLIGYRGVTVAGSTATGSHGSSPKHNSVLANLIRSIKLVNAEGEIVTYSKNDLLPIQWQALKTSLGLLGVIVELKIAVEPQFNLRVKTTYHREKLLFNKDAMMGQMKDCDFGQINWFPAAGKFVKACGMRTTDPADQGATNSLLEPDIPNFIIKPFKTVLQYGACHNWVSCLIEKVRYLHFGIQPYFKKLNKRGQLVSSHNVVGPSHKMTSSTFTEKAQGFAQMDWEIAVPMSQLPSAMLAVKKHIETHNICLPLIGLFIRFTRADDSTIMSHSSSGDGFKKGELIAFIEMPVFLPYGFNEERNKEYDSPYEEFTRILIQKFKGRAHWAKNRNWVFKMQSKIGKYPTKTKKFQSIITKMDPDGVFSNWFGKNIGFSWDKSISDKQRNICHSKKAPVINNKGQIFRNLCLALVAGEKRIDLKNVNSIDL
jgi:hypothetical protein